MEENRTFDMNLYVDLDEHEKAEIADELGSLNSRKKAVEARFAKVKADHKTTVDGIQIEIDAQFEVLSLGKKEVPVECEEWIDEPTQQIVTRRRDTGKIISARNMTEKEKQRKLVFAEEEREWFRSDEILSEGLAEFADEIGIWTSEDVERLSDEDFKTVDAWVSLKLYRKQNPKALMIAPVTPDILKPAEEKNATADAFENSEDFEVFENVKNLDHWTVRVEKEKVPKEKYTEVRFNEANGILEFYDAEDFDTFIGSVDNGQFELRPADKTTAEEAPAKVDEDAKALDALKSSGKAKKVKKKTAAETSDDDEAVN